MRKETSASNNEIANRVRRIIERIRKQMFGIGLDLEGASPDVLAYVKYGEKAKDDAARLATEINTSQLHFVLELIQNAEDNDYDPDITPMIKFTIQNGQILIQNNERGFEEKNVEALCTVGGTTKKDKRRGYIGEKGIGFKSVFKITNNPQIYSNGFQFEFRFDPTNPISIVIPHWINTPPEFTDIGETRIVLPLNEDVEESVINSFKQIHPSLILFLSKLKKLEIQNEAAGEREIIEKSELGKTVEVIQGQRKSKWVSRKTQLDVSRIKEERREGVEKSEIVMAFPLKPDGKASAEDEQQVFAFMPIRKYGFKFLIQADFILPVSREDIIKDKQWNVNLRDRLASVFCEAVEEFKQDDRLKTSFYGYIPVEGDVKDEFFLPVVKQIYDNLAKTDCVLTEGNRWVRPQSALIATDKARKLIPNDELIALLGREYVSRKIDTGKSALLKLGLTEFSLGELTKCLENTEWVRKHDNGWFAQLYEYLSEHELDENQKRFLKGANLIKLEEGRLTSVNKEKRIFFPLDKGGRNYGFEKELPVIDGGVSKAVKDLEKQKGNSKIRDFLHELGVQRADPFDIIETHILPMYEGNGWTESESSTLLGHVRYIKGNLERYVEESNRKLNAGKSPMARKEDPLDRLKKVIMLRITKTEGGKEWYDNPKNIHVTRAYGNTSDLEHLLEGTEASLIHTCYVDAALEELERRDSEFSAKKRRHIDKTARPEQEKSGSISGWKDFLLKLGAKATLIVERDPDTETYQGPHYTKNQVTKKYLREYQKGSTAWKDCEWAPSSDGYYVHNDWVSVDLQLIMHRIWKSENIPDKRDLCAALLHLLEDNWDELSGYVKCGYYYHTYGQFGWSRSETYSTFLMTLRGIPWIPTGNGRFEKPDEAFLNKPEIRELLGESAPYVVLEVRNEKCAEAMGINTKASVKSVLSRLIQLVKEKCQDRDRFENLFGFLMSRSDGHETNVSEAFSKNPLIYLPRTEKGYFNSQEVLWNDVSDIFGRNMGYLQGNYKEQLKRFFVDIVGVSEKPGPEDYAAVLLNISKRVRIEQDDEGVIIKIYRELDSHLDPDRHEHPISEENWWKEFITKVIFYTERQKFLPNIGNNIFVNDDPDLHELFKDAPSVAFLRLPPNYYPRIRHFIQATGIQYLSKSVRADLALGEKPYIQKELTGRIRQIIPYILRYLYRVEPDTYEKLKQGKALSQLNTTNVYIVEELRVAYTLRGGTKYARRKVFLHERNLVVQSDCIQDMDTFAVEFSALFGGPKGLDSFLNLLISKSADQIERLLSAKQIMDLPDEEKIPLETEESGSGKEEATASERQEGIEGTRPEEPQVARSNKLRGVEPVARKGSEAAPKPAIAASPRTQAESFTGEVVPSLSTGIHRAKDEQQGVAATEGNWQPSCKPEDAKILFKTYVPSDRRLVSEATGEMEGATEPLADRGLTPEAAHMPEKAQLSQEDRECIGKWGEQCAMKQLEMLSRVRYPNGVLEQTENGFIVKVDEKVVRKVSWLNKKRDARKGYDIKVLDGEDVVYIEVKSTASEKKSWFNVTGRQWRFMAKQGDKFQIYRVYGAGTERPAIECVINPGKLWKEGNLLAHPVHIKI